MARPNEIKAQSSRLTWKNCSLWLCNVHCWNATQYYSTETVLLIFPFLQTRGRGHAVSATQLVSYGCYVLLQCCYIVSRLL